MAKKSLTRKPSPAVLAVIAAAATVVLCFVVIGVVNYVNARRDAVIAELEAKSRISTAAPTEANEKISGPHEGEFTIAITPDADYEYTVYGQLHDIHTLIGSPNVAVAAFEPYNEGGVPDEGYGWRTVYIPADVLTTIGGDTFVDETDGTTQWFERVDEPQPFYEITMENCADGGGYINLPEIITSVKQIDASDIPNWGGA